MGAKAAGGGDMGREHILITGGVGFIGSYLDARGLSV